MNQLKKGFSMIELLIALAIIGIITAVALPQYKDYVTRARLTDAFTGLAGVPPAAEQFWSNNRPFVGLPAPTATANFTFAVSGTTTSAYTVTATGIAQAGGFVFTINQSGARATTSVPSGWTTNGTCWVDRKSGQCSI